MIFKLNSELLCSLVFSETNYRLKRRFKVNFDENLRMQVRERCFQRSQVVCILLAVVFEILTLLLVRENNLLFFSNEFRDSFLVSFNDTAEKNETVNREIAVRSLISLHFGDLLVFLADSLE